VTQRIVALFNLKPGVTASEYEAWARRVDLPTVNGLKSIDGFTILKSSACLGSEAKPPYQYIEIIDVEDMDGFGREIATPTMQKVAGEFRSFVDVTFILTDKLG